LLRGCQYRLHINASRIEGGLLRRTTRLDMGKRAMETLNASVQVQLKTLQSTLLFEEIG
jgi:hypothetical protein